ncbi:MAG: carbon monoxide dehydrogenase [Caldivirga sp. MG_3]|jgi:Uncharacterized conserved protein|nr:MAG: carbon monoxide dehydrogenase [Caldivirga sp. MG_3]
MPNLRYNGSFNIAKPPSEVFNRLTDLSFIARCIPNVASYELMGESRARVRFMVDLGEEVPIAELRRITADSTIEVVEAKGNSVKYRVNGRAAGSQIEVSLTLTIEPVGDGSRVNWSAEASLGRLLQLMSRFVNIDSMVGRIANDTVNGITKCLQ